MHLVRLAEIHWADLNSGGEDLSHAGVVLRTVSRPAISSERAS
jgi:hypothetical protein